MNARSMLRDPYPRGGWFSMVLGLLRSRQTIAGPGGGKRAKITGDYTVVFTTTRSPQRKLWSTVFDLHLNVLGKELCNGKPRDI